MSFNVESFKAAGLPNDGARPALFDIRILDWPGILGGASQSLTMNGKAASLPQSTIQEVNVGYFGRKIKLMGDRIYPNWQATIYNDEDFLIRNAMLNWHEQMNSTVQNLETPAGSSISPTDYKRDVIITQYSKGGFEGVGQPIYVCRLYGAFPVNIGPIQLDWDATNQIEVFTVEFTYDYWRSNPLDSSSPSNLTTIPATITVP